MKTAQYLLFSLLLVLLVGQADWCFAYFESYSPFSEEDKPESYELGLCKGGCYFVTLDGCDVYVADCHVPNQSNVYVHAWTNAGNLYVEITNSSGQVLAEPAPYPGCVEFGSSVSYADLNDDGVADYIMEVVSDGCGLAALNRYITFFLSGDAGYQPINIAIAGGGTDEAIVDIDQDGVPEFIYNCLIYGEKGQDGKRHNYWVYNALSFGTNGLVSANHKHPKLPAWVWFTYDENHKPTTQLTKKQRARLWRNQAPGIFPEELADEQ